MPSSRLTPKSSEKSPTDPHECCIWANARLHPDAVEAGLHWIVTGNKDRPIDLVKRTYGYLPKPMARLEGNQ